MLWLAGEFFYFSVAPLLFYLKQKALCLQNTGGFAPCWPYTACKYLHGLFDRLSAQPCRLAASRRKIVTILLLLYV
jgi:hypothetical protein